MFAPLYDWACGIVLNASPAVYSGGRSTLPGVALTEPRAIPRRSLHNEILERLRDLIVEGDLKPGAKIPEAELCVRFGVSRTPLREALKALAVEGLVTLQPNRGAIVAKATIEEIDALFPIMGALEALAGELACTRITDAEIAALHRDHAEMVKQFERGDWIQYSRLNRAIHEAIFAAAGNGALSALYQQLLVRTHSVRFVAKKSMHRWRQAVLEHEKMMAAIDKRDGRALARVLTLHLKHKAESVREAMQPTQDV
jgi:DNA-binding GntR family transcriptional regulator